ncbi:TetR/AcrR family transcriptional regulator [Pseudonocardia eucalypti]|uniref:TetR/AcrR family transcriptional regulator n=1 Tax=Pseudonocardia eucalypti TaxID=648755 RepID=A0ABP9QHT6_9PSEU
MRGVASPIPRRFGVREPTTERLLDAAAAELRASGPAALTVRLVAARAGISPATAYKVFSSKEHLLASVLLRHLRDLPPIDTGDSRPIEQRLPEFLHGYAAVIAADPQMQATLRCVFLGDDPDTARVRELFSQHFDQQFEQVCRDKLTENARTTIRLAFAGAMVAAGAGLMPFTEIRQLLETIVRTVNPVARR